MSEKRKAAMSAQSPETDERARKRRRHSDQNASDSLADVGLRMLRVITGAKDRNRYICKEFKHLPPKDVYPDYYDRITNPISLAEIESKLKLSRYNSLEDAVDDIRLMASNALTYNEAESQVAKDAIRIRELAEEFAEKHPVVLKAEANAEASPGVASATELQDAQIAILEEVRVLQDETGEPLSYFFDKLPDRKQYPDYYKIIKDPISLNTLKKRILAKKYTTWAAFEEDVTLIHTNAATYNEAGSAIIKDALKLKNAFLARIAEARKRISDGAPPTRSGAKIILNRQATEEEPRTPRTPIPKIRLGRGRLTQSETTTPTPQTNGRASRHNQTPVPSTNGVSRAASQQSDLASANSLEPASRYPSRNHGDAASPHRRGKHDVIAPRSETGSQRGSTAAMSPPPPRDAKEMSVRTRTETPSAAATGTSSPHPSGPTSQPSVTSDQPAQPDPRFRPPGTDEKDAIISVLEMYTDSRSWAMSFPADPKKLIQTFSTQLRKTDTIISILPRISSKYANRGLVLQILVNHRRINPSPLQNRPKEGSQYQAQLHVGYNMIEVVANITPLRGAGRTVNSVSESFVERYILHAYVMEQ